MNESIREKFDILSHYISEFKSDVYIEELTNVEKKNFFKKIQSDGVSIVSNFLGYIFSEDNEDHYLEQTAAALWYTKFDENSAPFVTSEKQAQILLNNLKEISHPLNSLESFQFIYNTLENDEDDKAYLAKSLETLFKNYLGMIILIDNNINDFEKQKYLEFKELLQTHSLQSLSNIKPNEVIPPLNLFDLKPYFTLYKNLDLKGEPDSEKLTEIKNEYEEKEIIIKGRVQRINKKRLIVDEDLGEESNYVAEASIIIIPELTVEEKISLNLTSLPSFWIESEEMDVLVHILEIKKDCLMETSCLLRFFLRRMNINLKLSGEIKKISD